MRRDWVPGGPPGSLCTGSASGRSLTGSGAKAGSGRGPGRQRERGDGEQGEAGGGRRHGRQCGALGRGPRERGQRGEPGAAMGAGRGARTWPRPSRRPPRPGPPSPAPPPPRPPGPPGCSARPETEPTAHARSSHSPAALPLKRLEPPTFPSSPGPAPTEQLIGPLEGRGQQVRGVVREPRLRAPAPRFGRAGAGWAPSDPGSTLTRVVTQTQAPPQGEESEQPFAKRFPLLGSP